MIDEQKKKKYPHYQKKVFQWEEQNGQEQWEITYSTAFCSWSTCVELWNKDFEFIGDRSYCPQCYKKYIQPAKEGKTFDELAPEVVKEVWTKLYPDKPYPGKK